MTAQPAPEAAAPDWRTAQTIPAEDAANRGRSRWVLGDDGIIDLIAVELLRPAHRVTIGPGAPASASQQRTHVSAISARAALLTAGLPTRDAARFRPASRQPLNRRPAHVTPLRCRPVQPQGARARAAIGMPVGHPGAAHPQTEPVRMEAPHRLAHRALASERVHRNRRRGVAAGPAATGVG
jgi:hypothetical protein